MSTLDIVIVVIVAATSLSGLWFGFVHTLGSLLGLIVGVFVASRYYTYVAAWLEGVTGWGENTARVLGFIILFALISRLVGLLFYLVEKFAHIIVGLPIVKTLNRLLGLVLGFLEGILSIGLAIYFIERVPLTDNIMELLSNSALAPYTVKAASILVPLIPDAVKMLDSTVIYIDKVV